MREIHMRKRSMVKLFLVSAGLSMVVAVTPALAQHNAPSKAKKLKVDLATAFNACGVSNDTTGGSLPLPACHPPTLTSSTSGTHTVTFGPKGAANVSVSAASDDMKIGVKSADVQDNGVLIADN